MPDFTFDPITIDPVGSRKVELELFGKCANFWRDNEQYSTSEYVRPNRGTGFAYQTLAGGTSGSREPIWPLVLGATVVDGSVSWICVAAATNGLNEISSPVASSDPTGLTISDVSASESTRILATYTPPSNSEGQQFEAIFDFNLNGVPRRVRQLVVIAKR